MPSITKQLLGHLKPVLPTTWDVSSVEPNLRKLARGAVFLSYVSSAVIYGGPAAVGKRYEIQLTYVSPVDSTYEGADDDLWDAEQIIETALQELPFVELTASQRGTWGNDGEGSANYWAHIFTLQVAIPYSTEPAPEPEPAPEEE